MDPALIDTLSDIGLLGGAIAAVIAFGRGWIVTGATLAKAEAASEKRVTEFGTKCDERIARLEEKLDAAALVTIRQSESQAQTISVLQETIRRIEAKV